MKINEIMLETVAQGEVYGWIDAAGKEHSIYLLPRKTGTTHADVIEYLISQETLDWDIPLDYAALTNGALERGWIRVGAMDHEYVFAQLIPEKVSKKAMTYLFRIMVTFKPGHIALDLSYVRGNGPGEQFDDYRKAIQFLRANT